ncbi:MAG: hypothetical protein ACSLFJ_02320 [Immundisolibacter sp.]|uniref:hypothetical protein n=1 Tax=Immundisolibacter sp. TaxID=1934948 RepID=UPI003EDE82EE
MKRLALIVLLVVLAWHWWPVPVPSVQNPPPMTELLPADPLGAPVQRNLPAGPQFSLNGIPARVLAEYAVSGRVLSSARYRLGRTAGLAPFDFALGWGRMSEPAVIEQLDISQRGRWYFWRYQGEPPLPPREIETSSANVHLIPADATVVRALRQVSAGQRVALRGYLLELRAADGWQWRSSMNREDTGDGSCELLYVQTVERP